MTHVVFLSSSMRSGGAERSISIMANYWTDSEYRVTVVTLDSSREDFYPLNSRVNRIGLGLMRPSRGAVDRVLINIRRLRAVRQLFKELQPDVVISFIDRTNVLALLASVGTGLPIVVAERNYPPAYSIGRLWGWLRKRVYRWAAVLVIQSEGSRDWALTHVAASQLVVIPNSVRALEIAGDEPPLPAPGEPFILAVGSLSYQKGFDMLIEAFSEIVDRFPGWHLVIIGEGRERESLEAHVLGCGLATCVHLPGKTANIAACYDAAEIFVLSSRFEGFPNVLMEAMSMGLAVVSFDCKTGPSDIIRDGENGILVTANDVDALGVALADLMSSPEKRSGLGERARSVNQDFSPSSVIASWEEVIRNVRHSKADH